MTRNVVTVQEATPFKEVALRLAEHRIGALPVTNAAGQVVGIVSQSDLLLKEEPPASDFMHLLLLERREHLTKRMKAIARFAGALMSAPAVTISPDASVAEAARLMHAKRVKRLPVVNADGQLVGIVSRGDLLRVFLRTDEQLQRDVGNALLHFPGLRDQLEVTVKDGVVSLSGRLRRRSGVRYLTRLLRELDGVVGFDNRLTYEVDDLFPPYSVTM